MNNKPKFIMNTDHLPHPSTPLEATPENNTISPEPGRIAPSPVELDTILANE